MQWVSSMWKTYFPIKDSLLCFIFLEYDNSNANVFTTGSRGLCRQDGNDLCVTVTCYWTCTVIKCFCLSFFIANCNFPYSPEAVIAGFVILPLIIAALVAGYIIIIIIILIKYKRKVKPGEDMPFAGDNANYGSINNVNNTWNSFSFFCFILFLSLLYCSKKL